MARSILQHVQNTLMIMSVLLVFLAFERLESLEDSSIHKPSPPSSLWPYPPYIDGSSLEEGEGPTIRIGSHHQLVFGHELRIGLFRFVLPRLKRTEATAPASSFLRKRFHSNIRGDMSQEEKSPKVAYVVPIDSCSSDTIDAAQVLQHSFPNNTLYAFFLNDTSAPCSTMLKGFRLVSPKEVFHKLDPSCVTRELLSLLLAHGLDADIVAYVPLPSLAVSTKVDSISSITSRFVADSRKHGLEETSMRVASNMLSVRTIRPQGKEVVTRVLDSIAVQCHSEHNVTSLDIVPWESCSDKRSCHVSESLVITTFADCPVPWSKNMSKEAECQELQRQWLHARESIRVEQRSDSQSARSE